MNFAIFKNKIAKLHKSIKESMEAYSPVEEFGIDDKVYNKMVKNIDDLFERMLKSEDYSKYELIDYSDENKEKEEHNFQECLTNPYYETIFERHGWKNVKDFYNEIPELLNNEEYFFLFKLESEKVNNTAFANTLLGILCMKNQDRKMNLKCNVISSDDESNHFWLLKFKS